MQEIAIILLVTALIDAWVNEFVLPQIIKGTKTGKLLDFKPMNCNKCLSFWFGVVFSVMFFNPVYMGIYLLTRLIK